MKNPETFTAGYARVDITPTESVPLAGYGNTMQRLSQGVLDPLFATFIALTDNENNTLLLCTLDVIKTADFYCNPARDAISKAYGIPRENIILSATHTHSGPDFSANEYEPIIRCKDMMVEKLTEGAGLALADRKKATMLAGRTYNEGMNFVRHYVLEDDSVAGDNFGSFKAAPIRGHVTDADRQIQIVRFCREGDKDILMVNWQAHPTKASTRVTEHGWTNRPFISADFVGACRAYVEEKTQCHFAYFQGACGNINSRSKIPEEDGVVDHVPYGQQLGDYILAGLEQLSPIEGGKAEAGEKVCTSPVNHTENHLLPYAEEIAKLWAETNDPALCSQEAKKYGMNSPYHARHIVEKSKLSGELSFTVGAAHFGELGIGAFPYEMFDTNGKQVKEGSPFKMTFILENANGANNYIPSAKGCEHGCYEADSCHFMPGTGEKAANAALELLNHFFQGK